MREQAAKRPRFDEQGLQLQVLTINGTTWPSTKAFLGVLDASVQVVLCQEHHLDEQSVPDAQAWCKKRGWNSIFAPAIATEAGGTQGGVSILAREGLGLMSPTNVQAELVKGRALAAIVQAPGYSDMMMVSLYLRHGLGIQGPNVETLVAIACAMEEERLPTVIGGDFNAGPSAVEESTFTERTRTAITKPLGKTCVTRNSCSLIDFFVVSVPLASLVEKRDLGNQRERIDSTACSCANVFP